MGMQPGARGCIVREAGSDYISGEAEFLAEANPGSDLVETTGLPKQSISTHC
jgi:hypothetical protein